MTAPTRALVHDRTHIDWITVTHDNERELRELMRGQVDRRRVGLGNYPVSFEDAHGALLGCGGPEPRPFQLRMSGQVLQAWRAEATDRSLINHLAFNGVHCTRIDIARDTAGSWTPEWLWTHLKTSRYLSLWRKFSQRSGLEGGGRTVYCGSRSSGTYLRVYDKRAEMEEKGKPCPFPRLTRWELELKKERAPVALRRLALLMTEVDQETGEERWSLRDVHARALGRQLTLTSEAVDKANKNQSRAAATPEWRRFVGSGEDLILAPELDERSIEQRAREFGEWMDRQLASAIATAYDLGGPEFVEHLCDIGRGRRAAKHELLLAHARVARRGLWSAVRRD